MAGGGGEAVGIERDRVDSFADEKGCELGIIARRLTADADLDPGRMRLGDRLGDHVLDGLVALVEPGGEVARIPVDAEHQLSEVVAADREAVEARRELLGETDVRGAPAPPRSAARRAGKGGVSTW